MKQHTSAHLVTLPDADVFLTEKEVGAMTGISPKTLQKYRLQSKGMVYYKVGVLVRYKLSDVQRYMEQFRVEELNISSSLGRSSLTG